MHILLNEVENIRNIAELGESIFKNFIDNEEIAIDASKCKEADLSFIQLIEAARIHAENNGKKIRLTEPVNGAIADALRRAGFLDVLCPEDANFWLHQESGK
jgi:hypothetical protein